MKREKPDYEPGGSLSDGGDKEKIPWTKSEKEKEEEEMDQLLAALGYKVRSSDMADVAQKLEQLDKAMAIGGCSAAAGIGVTSLADDGFVSHLSEDTVHYNPSDLSSWLESMLSEINAPPPPLPSPPRHFHGGAGDGDLSAIPSQALDLGDSSTVTSAAEYPPPTVAAVVSTEKAPEQSRHRKRMRTAATGTSSCSSSSSSRSSGVKPAAEAAVPVVVVDAQEAGIRLVHTLMACAGAVHSGSLAAAEALVNQITVLAASQGGAMRKVAAYFGRALARRIYRNVPSPRAFHDVDGDAGMDELLHFHFYENCPYLKFAHFTANQAILEAFAGSRRVHIVDMSINQGRQWPPLLQALALRSGGAPSVKLTAICPSPVNSNSLHQVGSSLLQFARMIHVDFDYRVLVADSIADHDLSFLASGNGGGSEPETVAINSVLELHRQLAVPGAIEKVLAAMRAARPRIVTVVEQEANHNAGTFLDRFTEALHYYSTMFDSMEASCHDPTNSSDDSVMSELYLGRQISNVVACEGTDRTERHETLVQWRSRFLRSGFEPVHLGSNAFKQASTLLALFGGAGDGYRVEEREGCLTLGWHTRPLVATSAWRIAASPANFAR